MKAAVATSLVAVLAGMAMAYPQSPSPSPSSSATESWSPAPDGTVCKQHSECGGCGPNGFKDPRGKDSSASMTCSLCFPSYAAGIDENKCSQSVYWDDELKEVRQSCSPLHRRSVINGGANLSVLRVGLGYGKQSRTNHCTCDGGSTNIVDAWL